MLDMFNVYLPIAEMQFNALILVAIGFSVGVLGGFFGVGGAWVVTPALNIFGFPMAWHGHCLYNGQAKKGELTYPGWPLGLADGYLHKFNGLKGGEQR